MSENKVKCLEICVFFSEIPQIECQKVKAPYPSYSEACYEEPPERPSECKLCPWRPENNPNFKPPKKKLHTSSARFASDKNV